MPNTLLFFNTKNVNNNSVTVTNVELRGRVRTRTFQKFANHKNKSADPDAQSGIAGSNPLLSGVLLCDWPVLVRRIPMNCGVIRGSGLPRNFVRGVGGSTNSVEDRGQREWGSGGGSSLVRGSGGSCNLVQEISLHIVKFS